MSEDLRAWAVHVLRFGLREPLVASGDAVLHVVDTGSDGPHRFRGSVIPGDRTVASEALRRAHAEEGASRWAVVFLTWLPAQEEAWLIADCAQAGAPQRFATPLRPSADPETGAPRMAAGRLVSLGASPLSPRPS